MKKVAILGGYGKVGFVAAKYLMKQGGAEIYICGRSFIAASEKAAQIVASVPHDSEIEGECRPYEVDIQDAAALRTLLTMCDVVVNCTGPTALIGDTVARAAIESDCHMVDPGGYDYVIEKIKDLEEEVVKRKLQVCFAAGIVPGISASLPLQMASEFSHVTEIKNYFAGEDVWSYGSMYDMVCGMGELKALGPCEVKNKRLLPLPLSERYVHFPQLPEPVGRSIAQPFYTKEFERVIKQTGSYSGKCFWVNTGPMFSAALSLVRLARCYSNPRIADISARILCKASALDNRRKNPLGYMLFSEVTGIQNGEMKTTIKVLRFPDSYTGTGLAAAMMAHRIVIGKAKKSGVGNFAEMLPPDQVLTILEEEGIVAEGVVQKGDVYVAVS